MPPTRSLTYARIAAELDYTSDFPDVQTYHLEPFNKTPSCQQYLIQRQKKHDFHDMNLNESKCAPSYSKADGFCTLFHLLIAKFDSRKLQLKEYNSSAPLQPT